MSNRDNRTVNLDLRHVPSDRRRTRIFETFAALRPGQSLSLVHDRHPAPLLFRFVEEHAGEFVGHLVEQGPSIWRIVISKREGAAPHRRSSP